MDVPPCITLGQPLNWCARQMYTWRISGHGSLPGQWAGWRLAGKYLVTPSGDRVVARQLEALIYHQVHLKKKRKTHQRRQDAEIVALFADLQSRIDRAKV